MKTFNFSTGRTLTIQPAKQKLPSDIKEQWITALRSGQYEQGKKSLCENGKYCCLGVLSKLQGRLTEDGLDGTDPQYRTHTLLSEDNPLYATIYQSRNEGGLVMFTLTLLNDRGVTFTEIADVIDYVL